MNASLIPRLHPLTRTIECFLSCAESAVPNFEQVNDCVHDIHCNTISLASIDACMMHHFIDLFGIDNQENIQCLFL